MFHTHHNERHSPSFTDPKQHLTQLQATPLRSCVIAVDRPAFSFPGKISCWNYAEPQRATSSLPAVKQQCLYQFSEATAMSCDVLCSCDTMPVFLWQPWKHAVIGMSLRDMQDICGANPRPTSKTWCHRGLLGCPSTDPLPHSNHLAPGPSACSLASMDDCQEERYRFYCCIWLLSELMDSRSGWVPVENDAKLSGFSTLEFLDPHSTHLAVPISDFKVWYGSFRPGLVRTSGPKGRHMKWFAV